MVKVKQDMTGWKMWEHGIPNSKLTVIKQVDDYISPKGQHRAQYLCRCNCPEKNEIIVTDTSLKTGNTLSCGCIKTDIVRSQKKINKKDLSGNYGIIWATNTNEKIYFDIEDAEKILNHAWRVDKLGYPATTINNKKIFMHTFLGFEWPDHNNRNKLDNRKENLILCTAQENNQNRTIGKNNTSGIIGVCWHKQKCQWESYIKINKNPKHLGFFINKEDAIKTRLQAEKRYFGKFAPQRHLFKKYGIESEGDILDI